jgi:hypothetical protein
LSTLVSGGNMRPSFTEEKMMDAFFCSEWTMKYSGEALRIMYTHICDEAKRAGLRIRLDVGRIASEWSEQEYDNIEHYLSINDITWTECGINSVVVDERLDFSQLETAMNWLKGKTTVIEIDPGGQGLLVKSYFRAN